MNITLHRLLIVFSICAYLFFSNNRLWHIKEMDFSNQGINYKIIHKKNTANLVLPLFFKSVKNNNKTSFYDLWQQLQTNILKPLIISIILSLTVKRESIILYNKVFLDKKRNIFFIKTDVQELSAGFTFNYFLSANVLSKRKQNLHVLTRKSTQ